MSEQTKSAHLKLSGGPDVVAAAVATVEHFAEEANLNESVQQELMEAIQQVCTEALRQMGSKERALDVTVEQFADRIEIAVAHASIEGPVVGLDSFLGPGAGAAGSALLAKVDRVRYDSSGKVSRMILVKYLPGGGKPAN